VTGRRFDEYGGRRACATIVVYFERAGCPPGVQSECQTAWVKRAIAFLANTWPSRKSAPGDLAGR